MSVSLVYDKAISRVEIAADGLAIVDTFGRTVANGWGTADTGQAWTAVGGPTADYSVNGTLGVHSVSAVNSPRRTVAGAGILDVDITCNMVVGVLATGASIIFSLLARYIDINNLYLFEAQCNTDQSITLRLVRIVGGVQTVLASLTHPTETHQTNDNFAVRFQVAGATLRAKLWHTPDPEPAAWTIQTIDSTPWTKPGAVGCRSALNTGNTNTLPVVITYNDFTAKTNPTPVRLERTYDNETWAAVRGAVSLTPANGAVSALDYEFGPDVPNTYRVNAATVSALAYSGQIVTAGDSNAVNLDVSGLNLDLAGRILRLTLSIDRPRNIGSLQFLLGVGGLTNTIKWLFNAGTSTTPLAREGETFSVLLQLAELDSAAGTISISSAGVASVVSGFTDARLRVSDNGTPITVVLHSVELLPAAIPLALCSITFDDSLISTTTLAYPKMSSLGFRGTDYVIVSTLDDGSHATLSDLQTRSAAGWEIAGHAFSSSAHGAEGLAGLTAAAARADLAAMYRWLDTNFPHAFRRYSYAYPIGEWTQSTDGHRLDRLVREAGFCCARTTLAGSGSEVNTHVSIASPRPPHPFRLYGMSGISSLASGQRVPANLVAAGGMLDKVAGNGGWINLVFHRVVAGAPASTTEISQTDFDSIMDAIAAKGLTVLPVREVLDQLAATTTPELDRVWLKSPVDPTVNTPVTVVGFDDPARPARAALFDVVGRHTPVAVSDVRASRQFNVELYTPTRSGADGLDEALSGGNTMLLHTPADCRVPGGYVSVADVTQRRTRARGESRVYTLPCTEVAAP